MSASLDECVAAYPRTQLCTDRLYSRLLSWAAYTAAQPLPPDTSVPPDKAFVQQRVLAERTPVNGNFYTQQLTPYTLETPNVRNSIRSFLNGWNDDATETTLGSELDSVLASVMPKFADTVISDQDVANWCTKNGYPTPAGLSSTVSSFGMPLGPGPAPLMN